jgi:hypothetical protein
MTIRKWLVLAALLFAPPSAWAQDRTATSDPEFAWRQSLPLNPGEKRIMTIGGTELRALTIADGKLFAAMGYWRDTEMQNPSLPGAQVLRLDSPDAPWRVDLELTDRNARGLRLYQTISILKAVRFTTDSAGKPLDAPTDILMAGVWKRGPGLDVFSRVFGSMATPWWKSRIPGQEDAPRGTQIRSFALHKDRVTGVDIVFAGAVKAVFAGVYSRDHGNIDWRQQPDWVADASVSTGESRGRVASLLDCGGKLYAAAYDTLYQRVDGQQPVWRPVFKTEIHAQSSKVTGLRGLDCVDETSSGAPYLLATVEDDPARIYRIEPDHEFKSTLELNVSEFLTRAFNMEARYAIVAYNDMMEYPDGKGACRRRFLGLEVATPEAPVTYNRHNPDAHYLVRECNGSYAVREVRDPQIVPKPQLVAVRAMAVSPFPADPAGTIYAGGFDANSHDVHNTAWLYRGVPANAAVAR